MVVLAFCVPAAGGCGALEEAATPRPLPEYTRGLPPGTSRTPALESRLSFKVRESWKHLPMGEAKPRPLPEHTRKLDPGTYRTEEFEPAFSFGVGEGWRHLPMEESDDLALAREQRLSLRFFEAREVYKPDESYGVVGAPDDPVGWLRRHPFLRTSAPRTVTVGGIEGRRIDVTVVGDLPEGHRVGACGPDCVGLFGLGDGTALGVAKGDKVREIVLEDVEGETVIVGFGSPASMFEALAVPEAMEVIDTVEWRSS